MKNTIIFKTVLVIIIIIQTLIIINYELKKRRTLKEEIEFLQNLITNNYKKQMFDIRGGELTSGFWDEKLIFFKQYNSNLENLTNDNTIKYLKMVEDYCPDKTYYEKYKSLILNGKFKKSEFKTRLIEYVVLNEIFDSRNFSFYPIDRVTTELSTKQDTIKLGEVYYTYIYFIGYNSQAPFIAVLNNEDTLENKGAFPYFEEKPKRKGLIKHSGKYYVFKNGEYSSVDFNIDYFVK